MGNMTNRFGTTNLIIIQKNSRVARAFVNRFALIVILMIASVPTRTHFVLAQTLPAAPPTMREESMPPSGAASPVVAAPGRSTPATSTVPPTTIPPTAPGASAGPGAAPSTPPKIKHRRTHQARKPPNWVLQSKVQLALQSDPRFKNVRVTVTQPGVLVLEGQVFDRDALEAAGQTTARVEGVKRVINALTTQTLHWLEEQVRVNEALAQAGYKLVSVKVIGNTAYLTGQVPTNLDKQKVETIVLTAAPDLRIGTNLITTWQ